MNHYENQFDADALEEAHKILTHEIPSSPETYAMVQKFYGKAGGVEQHTPETQSRISRKRNNAMRTVRVGDVSRIRTSV